MSAITTAQQSMAVLSGQYHLMPVLMREGLLNPARAVNLL